MVLMTIITLPINSNALSTINLKIDGEQINFTSGKPYIDERNRTQIPVRDAAEAFGADISWNSETKTVEILYFGTKVELPIGCKYMIVNGKTTTIDTEARIKDDRTYLPIRPVFEALGATVNWDGTSNTIVAVKNDSANKYEQEILSFDAITFEDFRDMFKYEGNLIENSNSVWVNATYKGSLSDSEFAKLWKSIPNEILENYLKNIAIEKQRKNPQYDVTIKYAHGRTGIFVEYSLGMSGCSKNGLAFAKPENPFESKEINPLD